MSWPLGDPHWQFSPSDVMDKRCAGETQDKSCCLQMSPFILLLSTVPCPLPPLWWLLPGKANKMKLSEVIVSYRLRINWWLAVEIILILDVNLLMSFTLPQWHQHCDWYINHKPFQASLSLMIQGLWFCLWNISLQVLFTVLSSYILIKQCFVYSKCL